MPASEHSDVECVGDNPTDTDTQRHVAVVVGVPATEVLQVLVRAGVVGHDGV